MAKCAKIGLIIQSRVGDNQNDKEIPISRSRTYNNCLHNKNIAQKYVAQLHQAELHVISFSYEHYAYSCMKEAKITC